MRVCALVPSELIDQDADIAVIVSGAAAAAGLATSRDAGAVSLGSVLEGTALQRRSSVSITIVRHAQTTHLIVPGACTVGVSALESGEDVDQDARVTVQVARTFAVAAAAVAGEGDGLTGERASVETAQRGVCWRTGGQGRAGLGG